MLQMWLERDGEVVAKAVDDGNEGDDNLSMSLLYKEKVERRAYYCVRAENYHIEHKIPEKQLQIGARFYGPGHNLNEIHPRNN